MEEISSLEKMKLMFWRKWDNADYSEKEDIVKELCKSLGIKSYHAIIINNHFVDLQKYLRGD